jgi:hypothetical protein
MIHGGDTPCLNWFYCSDPFLYNAFNAIFLQKACVIAQYAKTRDWMNRKWSFSIIYIVKFELMAGLTYPEQQQDLSKCLKIGCYIGFGK